MVLAAIRLEYVLNELGLNRIRLIYSPVAGIKDSYTISEYEFIDKKGTIPSTLPNDFRTKEIIRVVIELINSVSKSRILHIINKEKEISIRQLSLKSGISYPYVYKTVNELRLLELINVIVYQKDKTKAQNCSINANVIEILTK